MSTPIPQSVHDALAPLAGVWVGTETMAPSEWAPKGGTADARVDNRLDLDGFVVVQNYEQRRGEEVTHRGHAVVWWDAKSKKYAMTWWDSMGKPPNVFRGDWENGALVLMHHSKDGISRATMRFDDDRYRFTMELSPKGKKWSTWMTGNYRREG